MSICFAIFLKTKDERIELIERYNELATDIYIEYTNSKYYEYSKEVADVVLASINDRITSYEEAIEITNDEKECYHKAVMESREPKIYEKAMEDYIEANNSIIFFKEQIEKWKEYKIQLLQVEEIRSLNKDLKLEYWLG